MTEITEHHVKKIARLARLELSTAQIPSYIDSLSKIITFVEVINQLDTSDVEPMAHPQDNTARMRDDEVIETNQRELFQQSAPDTEAGLYLVPKVITECEIEENS